MFFTVLDFFVLSSLAADSNVTDEEGPKGISEQFILQKGAHNGS